MATSGSTDLSATRDDIITEALELLGVIPIGVSPDSDTLTSCSRTLNYMIKMWQAEGIKLFKVATETIDLVASTATYTPTSTVFKILEAKVIDSSSNEIPVRILNRPDYVQLSDKTSTGVPVQLWYDENTETIYLWPVPSDTTYDLKVWITTPLEDLDSASDDVDFPQEWYMALAYNLAAAIAPKYGVDQETKVYLVTLAEEYKEIAEGFDREVSITFQADVK